MLTFLKSLFKSSTTPVLTQPAISVAENVLFTPLYNFFSEELKSQYVTGQLYTVRPGNQKLARFVEKWITDNQVRIVDSNAKIVGNGKVS